MAANHLLDIIYHFQSQNCSIGLMIRSNETPILNSAFELMKNEVKSELTPIMFTNMESYEKQTYTALALLTAFIYLTNYVGHFSYMGEVATDCFIWMLENPDNVGYNQPILMNSATKKLAIVVGSLTFSDKSESHVPIAHINQFGHVRMYCPTFNGRFWTSELFYAHQLDYEFAINLCSIKSYIRYRIQVVTKFNYNVVFILVFFVDERYSVCRI